MTIVDYNRALTSCDDVQGPGRIPRLQLRVTLAAIGAAFASAGRHAHGRTIVGRGGTGIGYVSADGQWCDKTALKPVDVEGQEIEPVASSYSAPIKLFETATCDEYLSHNIRLVYQLQTDDDTSDLMRELQRGTIFTFPYSYRGGLEADAAFLLLGDDGNMFLAVGNPTKVEFIGLQQTAAIVEEDGDTEETDLMDFDMI